MKIFKLIAFSAILISTSRAQPRAPIVNVNSAPSGACQNAAALQRVISTGHIFSCQSGIWGDISSGSSSVGPVNAVNYQFSQTPGGSLIGGSGNTVTLSPCPLGLNGTDTAHYLYVSNGTGTAESVLISGGSCTSGASTGTVTFTPANSHSGAWTISSTTVGIQEAINLVGSSGGGTVFIPAGSYLLLAPISVLYNNITIQGQKGMCCQLGTWIHRTGDFGSSITVGSATLANEGFNLYDVSMSQDINYVEGSAGNFGTIVNKPTSGAHLVLYGTNTVNIERCRFENMPDDVVINGAVLVTMRDDQITGLWDSGSTTVQVTKAGILIEQTTGSGAGIPTYITIDNITGVGYLTAFGTYNGAGPLSYIEFDSCEDCLISNGSLGGANGNNVLISGINPHPMLNIRIIDVKFDSSRLGDLQIQSDGTEVPSYINVIGNIFNGENTTDPWALNMPWTSGALPVHNLMFTGNQMFAYSTTTPINSQGTAGTGDYSTFDHDSAMQVVPPVLTGCDTAPSLGGGSTDISGQILSGTGSITACIITFHSPWYSTGTSTARNPYCIVTSLSNITPPLTGANSTFLTIDPTSVSTYYNYHCQ